MRKKIIFIITFVLVLGMVLGGVVASWVIAQGGTVPLKVNFQGYLTDPGSQPLSGNYTLTFSIYNVATGGTALWSETQTLPVNKGIFNAVLGTQTALSKDIFTGTSYIGVKVGSDAEMTPRQEITSVPYAIHAQNAYMLDGHSATDFASSSQLTQVQAAVDGLVGSLTSTLGGTNTGLYLDGVFAGYVYKVETDLTNMLYLNEVVEGSPWREKSLVRYRPEPIILTVHPAMNQALCDWVKASIESALGGTPKNGSIVVKNTPPYSPLQIDFHGGYIIQVDFPALNNASTADAQLKVWIQPESSTWTTSPTLSPPLVMWPLQWRICDFQFNLTTLKDQVDLSQIGPHTAKIDVITYKRPIMWGSASGEEGTIVAMGNPSFENISITIPRTYAQPLLSSITNGFTTGVNEERSGTLQYKLINGQVLLTVTFGNMGIVKISPEIIKPGESPDRITAKIYVERIYLGY